MTRKSKSSLLTICTLLFLIIINQIELSACTDSIGKDKFKKNTNDSKNNVGCKHLADFHYEIILGVTSFPTQGVCTEQQEAEIAAFLQDQINSELDSLPGTIRTKNKVCGSPVNNLRRLLSTTEQNSKAFSNVYNGGIKFNRTITDGQEGSSSFFQGSVYPKREQNERILRHRRRAYIYVGGGKCRFCLKDNFDHRVLLSPQLKEFSMPTSFSNVASEHKSIERRDRNLMYLYFRKTNNRPIPKVADISLCKDRRLARIFLDEEKDARLYKGHVVWKNQKKTSFNDKQFGNTRNNLLGPYAAGEQFGVQLTMDGAINVLNNKIKLRYNTRSHAAPMVKQPVKEGSFYFQLYAFDVPKEFSAGILADDPLYLFINGIKIDFNLLISQLGPGAGNYHKRSLRGTSFAGIKWSIAPEIRSNEDFGYGPLPDRQYMITITAPLLVFDHRNQLDIDFIIKPNAKAGHYLLNGLEVTFLSAGCEVTGLENSIFDDFKSAVESRLFHKLGVELARKFQLKKGHCLYDKIPVVEPHLVEKQGWKESNPRCRS